MQIVSTSYFLQYQRYSRVRFISLLDIHSCSEFARLLGIDFFSVLSRGSQYRVESIILRLTKPQNYILLSPSRQQVPFASRAHSLGRQPECSRMHPVGDGTNVEVVHESCRGT